MIQQLTAAWKEIQNSKIDGEKRPFYFKLSGSKIIAIGRESSREVPTDKVSVFDLNHTDQGWRRIASLNRADVTFNLVTNEGVMFAFSSEEKYYEYYDESLNNWTIVRPPKWPKLDFMANVSHDGLIYVTCATRDERRPLYSYDPSKKIWNRLADYLSFRTSDHDLLSYRNSLVKIDYNQIEIYDIEDAKTWKVINNDSPTSFGVCLVKKSMLDKSDKIKDIRNLDM